MELTDILLSFLPQEEVELFDIVAIDNQRSTNASAESFNAKVKAFRTQFRGVREIPFFIFRQAKFLA